MDLLSWPLTLEDDAVLEAALRFLDDHVPGEALEATVGSFDDGCHRRIPTRSQPSRRRKQELDELRKEVKDLEKAIAQFRSREEVQATVSDIREGMVSRQLTYRLKVEAENDHLRDLIREQNDMVQHLSCAISEREAQVKNILRWRPNSYQAPATAPDHSSNSTEALESVTSTLLPMFFQTKWVLAQPEFQSDGRWTGFKKLPGVERPALHVLESRLVPFALEATSEAVWANLVSQLGSGYESHDPPSYVLRTHREEWVEIPDFRGLIRATMALLRFDDEDRVVFVRSAVYTYLDLDGRNRYVAFPGLTTRQSLWTIVQRSQFSGLSQILTLSISTPAFVPKTESQSVLLDRYLADLCNQFVEFTHDDVDNRLLHGKGRSLYCTDDEATGH